MKPPPHIIVVEDDPDTRELLELVLGRAGFRVSLTDDCAQVLNVLATEHVDALLLDNQMPKMSGIFVALFAPSIGIFQSSFARALLASVIATLLLRLARKVTLQNRLMWRD